jgi:hypothetical protein
MSLGDMEKRIVGWLKRKKNGTKMVNIDPILTRYANGYFDKTPCIILSKKIYEKRLCLHLIKNSKK